MPDQNGDQLGRNGELEGYFQGSDLGLGGQEDF